MLRIVALYEITKTRTKREGAVPSLLDRRVAGWFLGIGLMTSMSANAGPLPERVEKAAQERIAAGTYQSLVFGVVDGDNSEVVAFGKLDDRKAPDGDTVYEIGSITKTAKASRRRTGTSTRWRGRAPSVPPPMTCCAI
jgi:CubicO group peptidase (beta-lactamase class C family)